MDFKELIERHKLKINGVIHVGAHWFEEWSLYRELKIGHKVFFEADPDNFNEGLKRNGVPDNVWLENLACGNENKMIELNYEERNQGQSNTILEPALCLEQYPDIVYKGKKLVKMIRLDDYHNDITPMNFLAMDVEGYELEVLKGATKHLQHIDYILTEVSCEERYKGQPMVEDLDSFLSPFGFERVETNWGGINWGDALYIKTKPVELPEMFRTTVPNPLFQKEQVEIGGGEGESKLAVKKKGRPLKKKA